MGSPVHIGSTSEWNSLLSGTSVVVADFYADWCGPCKMIAPHFENLAKQHSQPKKLAFAKIDVESQSEISRSNGVSAMPTFKIFHNGTCVDTIKGANPSALTAAVTKAKALSGGGAGGATSKDLFKNPGRTLGGPGVTKGSGRSLSWSLSGLLSGIVSFLGLYIVSLFSLNAYGSAEKSTFNVHRVPQKPSTQQRNGGNGGKVLPPRGQASGVKTLADL